MLLHWRLSEKFYLVQLVAFAVIILLSSLLQQFTVLHNVSCCCSTCKCLCMVGRLHLMPPFKHWRHIMPALIMRPALTIASEWFICQCGFVLTIDYKSVTCQCRSTLTVTPSFSDKQLTLHVKVFLMIYITCTMACYPTPNTLPQINQYTN